MLCYELRASNTFLFLIDLEKESITFIMVQFTFWMHKICFQYKKIILSTIYIQSFARRIVAPHEHEFKVNVTLSLQNIRWRIGERQDFTQIMAHI